MAIHDVVEIAFVCHRKKDSTMATAKKPAATKAAPAPKGEESKKAKVAAPALGNLNWSIKTGANGQGPEDDGDNAPQGQDRGLARRRPARRR